MSITEHRLSGNLLIFLVVLHPVFVVFFVKIRKILNKTLIRQIGTTCRYSVISLELVGKEKN